MNVCHQNTLNIRLYPFAIISWTFDWNLRIFFLHHLFRRSSFRVKVSGGEVLVQMYVRKIYFIACIYNI